MTWQVAVAGTLHNDDLTTPAGRHDALGGSAVYFSLAASRYAPVHLNGIVGRDTVDEYRRMLSGRGIDLEGLAVSDTPTFRWHAVHDFERWRTASESSEPGCDPEWVPMLTERSRRAEVFFVGSMDPSLQRAVIDQSRARFIGADSMAVFIDSRPDEVRAVLERVDIVFLTEAELYALTGSDDWRSSAAAICGTGRLRAVVVKLGPRGAACVTADRTTERPAVPVAEVVDPTGAGDALAGGFLGFVAQAERTDDDTLDAALSEGISCAADAIVAFGTGGLVTTRAV